MKDTQSVQSWQEVVVEADQEMEDVEEEESVLVCFGSLEGDLGCSSKRPQLHCLWIPKKLQCPSSSINGPVNSTEIIMVVQSCWFRCSPLLGS